MGTDIHFAFQGRESAKKEWFNITCHSDKENTLYRKTIFDGRSYMLFDWLQNLTDDLLQCRCPEELENVALYYDKEWDCYLWDTKEYGKWMWGYGFVTLAQFKDAVENYKNKLKSGIWVSEDFYEKFLEDGGQFPEEWKADKFDLKIISDDDNFLLSFLHELISNFEKFAKFYGLDDSSLRICWCFDN